VNSASYLPVRLMDDIRSARAFAGGDGVRWRADWIRFTVSW
jgi:hypothetical protein